MAAYPVPASSQDPFSASREAFSSLVSTLQAPTSSDLTHDKLEALIAQNLRGLGCMLYQDFITDRSRKEQRLESVRGSDGKKRTHCRSRTRSLLTIFGIIMIPRFVYSARGLSGLSPLEGVLNLPQDHYSYTLRSHAAIEATRGSFEEAKQAVERATGSSIPKRQLEEIVQRSAQDFEEFYKSENRVVEPVNVKHLLILSVDQKGVVMRPEDLTEATQKAAKENSHKLEGRLSKGEKLQRKRMATVAAVYDLEPHERGPEDILRRLRGEPEIEKKPELPKALNKRVWARIDCNVKGVVKAMFDEAERRDPKHKRRWVVLVDGAREQIKRIKAEARRRGIKVTIIIDIIHVLEYIWKAAWCFYKEGDKEAQVWVGERILEVLRGRASAVAGGIRQSATKRGLSADKRKNADRCANYLLRKKDMLLYDEYLSGGMPIATGVIEGACRHLVKDRMDLTGARWSLKGAEAILRLRSIRSSQDFESYWEFHLEQERTRNPNAGLAIAA